MTNLITRAYTRWVEADRAWRNAQYLAQLPEHLLTDMGIVPGGAGSIARQIQIGER